MKTLLTIILLMILAFGISWICTCGLVYLISLCFSFTFTWALATGVWLILLLIGAPVRIITKSK